MFSLIKSGHWPTTFLFQATTVIFSIDRLANIVTLKFTNSVLKSDFHY